MNRRYFVLPTIIVLLMACLIWPVTAGGPDNFGYKFIDSNSPNGPAYNWIEISGSGIQVLPDSDDIWISNIPLGAADQNNPPFFFNYYGTDYSQIAISNNGLLFSVAPTQEYINEPIKNSPAVHGFIAPYWDDIVTWGSADAIYYQTLGNAPNRIFVVEWKENQHYSSSTSGITFEVILYEGTNNILMQYKDVDFGTVSGAVGGDNPPYNNGGSATVGIESPSGSDGLQYSFNEQLISPESAILFEFPQFAGTNLYLSKNAPPSMNRGNSVTFTLYFNNFGSAEASNVILTDNLPPDVEFVSASDGGIYESATRKVTWNIGTVAIYPSGRGTRTITVRIPETVSIGTVIQNTALISTSTLETRYDDNSASSSTSITGLNLPPEVSVVPIVGNLGGTPSIFWNTPITFSYHNPTATGVNIKIHLDDGGPDIIGSMVGGPPDWTYTITFYPRTGRATVTYTVSGESCTIDTNWGLSYENDYNSIILEEISEVWGNTQPPLSPMIVKAIIATESDFNKDATTGTFCGLMQTPCSYTYSGIHAGTWHDPRTAIHVGLIHLREKVNDIRNPDAIILGKNIPQTIPTDAELWKYSIDAYNGGQGTMWYSMAVVVEQGKDHKVWQNIVEPQNNPTVSPLYAATSVIFPSIKMSKYTEIKNYIIGPRGVQYWLSLSGTSIENLATTDPCVPSETFNIYIDPAGYIYDVDTLGRISGANVWLQRSDGQGGWEDVPTGQALPIMQPDVNPLTTGANGQYQWDVLEGAYRVHVEASNYYPADSIVVNIPPPVFDLNIGLHRIPGTDEPPVADANGPTNGFVGETLSFDGFASHDPYGTIVSYQWTFGDGGSGVGAYLAHIYSTPGNYDVSLTVTDNGGLSDSESIPLTISLVPPQGLPVAVVSITPNPGIVGQSIQLDGSLSYHQDPTKSIDSWMWDVNNDGTYEIEGKKVIHSFSTAGSYPLKLQVSDNGDPEYFAETTLMVVIEDQIPVPEFPSMFLPVTIIIGMLGAVLLIQRTKEH